MYSTNKFISLCISSIFALYASASMAAEFCSPSPEEAAKTFVRWGVEDTRRTTELIQPKSLAQFRLRLQQIVDDRYSPDSAALRTRLLGPDWTQERIATVSDKELVGQFFAEGEQRRSMWRISNVQADESSLDLFSDRKVTISYRLESPAGSATQKREFSVRRSEKCWLIDVPLEAWVRLNEISKILKESRERTGMARQGPSRVTLQVAAASETELPGMTQLKRRGEAPPVWVEQNPLLTEADVIHAYASWDCEAAGLGPEEPAIRLTFSPGGAQAMQRWSQANMGSMLAVVLDSQLVVFARVTGVLGGKLSVCLSGETLERAQARAADLLGATQ